MDGPDLFDIDSDLFARRYPDESDIFGMGQIEFGAISRSETRLTGYACNKVLRNAFQQFAWHSTRAEAWALAYYQRKRQEGKTHPVAVRALATSRLASYLSSR